MKTRGLDGVKLVMSDAHTGLKKANGTVFQGAGWQRCRVHFMRNVLAVVPKGSQDMVASIIRTTFAQPDREHIEKQFREVTTMLSRSHPKVAATLIDAQPDLLAFAAFPQRHWRQIWSTNPLERVNKEPANERAGFPIVLLTVRATSTLAGAGSPSGRHLDPTPFRASTPIWSAAARRCRPASRAMMNGTT